ACSIGAHRILEIGTLAAYSTIWLARALADGGTILTLEAEPRHAEVARRNIDNAGLSNRVEILVGDAQEALKTLNDRRPFDFTFIDANKTHTADYFDWAVELSRPGSLIVVDNVVRAGAVSDPDSEDPSVRGIQRL